MSTTVLVDENVVAIEEPGIQALVADEPTQVTIIETPATVLVAEAFETIQADDITEVLTLVIQESAPITLESTEESFALINVEEQISLSVVDTTVILENAMIGPQGPQGPPGPKQVYVSPAQPVGAPSQYLWVQTGLGSDGLKHQVWFNDGLA